MTWKSEAQRLQAELVRERELCLKLQAMLRERGVDLSLEELQQSAKAEGVPAPEHALDHGLAEYMDKMTSVLAGAHDAGMDSCEVRFEDLGFEADVTVTEGAGMSTVASVLAGMLSPGSRKTETRTLLQGWTGAIKPETMTLVLGPPGSGKSLLLKALAGRLEPSAHRRQTGSLTFDGLTVDEFVTPRALMYVNQKDEHLPTLTVKETFDFASAVAIDERDRFMADSTDEQKARMRDVFRTKNDVLLQVLGLKRVENTIVGNDMLRGVSGGEKKRVTSGEMLSTMTLGWFLDEVSTGLDSSATFDICSALKTSCKFMHASVTVALLQPPPEVYELFDQIAVLGPGGRCVYLGPREEVLPYFESIGYRCPPRKDTADFLVELTTDAGRAYVIPEMVEAAPASSEAFAAAFRETELHRANVAALAEPTGEATWLRFSRKRFAKTWLESARLLWRRQNTLNSRDLIFVYGRFAQALVMAVVVGTLFLGTGADDFQAKFGLLFFTAILLSMASMAAIPVIIDARNVVYKHINACFFPTSAYVVAESVANWPLAAVEVTLYTVVLHVIVGLDGNLGVELLIGFFLSNVMSQAFKTVAAIASTAATAQPLAGVYIVMCLIFSGFVAAPDQIEAYWEWAYRFSPMAWIMRAYAINEFRADVYEDQPITLASGQTMPSGEVYLRAYGYDDMNEQADIPLCLAVVLGEYLFFLLVNTLALRFVRHDGAHQSSPTADVASDEDIVNSAETAAAAGRPAVAMDDLQAKLHAIAEGDAVDDNNELSLPFEKVTLAFRDMSYSVDLKGGERLPLLNEISGYAKPGTMTALMGSSGAGKTTLLDVLAGRKTGGHVTGDILVNGFPKDTDTFNRVAGYVEQTDILSPNLTVRETLEFSANLRLPHEATDEQRKQSVEQTLQLLELTGIADKPAAGLSTEQAKRVTIGVELVANPSVIFLDEPTSGLDARAAMVVMKAVRRIASTGRSVLCTIHQPSAELFEMFDSLLLLKRGGHTVFFGPVGESSSSLIAYLEGIEGTPPIAPTANPATWMLEVIGAGTAKAGRATDYATEYQRSALRSLNADELDRLCERTTELVFASKYARPGGTQLALVMRKAMLNYWRSPAYSLGRMAVNVAIAAIFGSIYVDQDYGASSALISRTSLLFITAIFMGFTTCMMVLPGQSRERTVFYREKAVGMYQPWTYSVAYATAELPYLVVSVSLFVNVFYWIVGLNDDGDAFAHFWVFMFLFVAFSAQLGIFLVFATPNDPVAQLLAAGSSALQCLFAGFLIPIDSVPAGWQFMTVLMPARWAFQGIIVTQFDGDTTPVQNIYGTYVFAENFVAGMFPDWERDDAAGCIWALVIFNVLARVGTCWAMTRVNWMKR